MLKPSVKNVISNTNRKYSFRTLIKKMPKRIPDFYKSILEAAERGESWGISIEHVKLIQLEIDINSFINK